MALDANVVSQPDFETEPRIHLQRKIIETKRRTYKATELNDLIQDTVKVAPLGPPFTGGVEVESERKLRVCMSCMLRM